MWHVRVLSSAYLMRMNGREHDIIEVVGKTEIRYFISLLSSLHAAFLYPEREELQNVYRIKWDLGCDLLP